MDDSTIPERLIRSAQDFPHAPALSDGIFQLDYRGLEAAVAAVANGLASDVVEGDRVALHLPRCAEYVVLYLAVLALGASVVAFSPELSEAETAADLADTRPVLLVRGTSVRSRLPSAGPRVVDVPTTAARDGDLTGLLRACGSSAGAFPRRRIDPGDVAVMPATSGSFGLPKRVMLTHRALLANARAHRRSLDLDGVQETALVTVPLNFGYCNTVQLVGQLDSAGHIVLLEGDFLPSRFGRLVARHRVTSTLLVPAMLRLMAMGGWQRDHDLSSLRHIVYGGAPTPPDVLAAIGDRLPGAELVETYGQTEAGPRVTTMRQRDRARHPTSVGTPVPGVEVVVRDSAGVPLPPGRSGEVTVRGPSLMTGYFGRPQETVAVLRDGWLWTGDIGRLDTDGHLHLTGRTRNIAIVAGINVALEEVERALVAHPTVVEAVCAVVADERAGEALVAHVRLVPGADAAGLREHCRTELSPHKVPRRIVAVDDFPRTRTGKVDRAAVAGLVAAAPTLTERT
ncbi:class I adenylate-forming enzyme family protein [Saccharopolyspora sp. 5N708]|uniref:class I adenylate-forming enzyme family protein n=1 Tax=Saccharopolyspora sp. 5N708 TaxID=3457424 RepID=UPI003FD4CBAA